jgi:rRNA maturation endonuclease Nob1
VLKAKCPKCGLVFHGWALQNPQSTCARCGGPLEIESKHKDVENKIETSSAFDDAREKQE